MPTRKARARAPKIVIAKPARGFRTVAMGPSRQARERECLTSTCRRGYPEVIISAQTAPMIDRPARPERSAEPRHGRFHPTPPPPILLVHSKVKHGLKT